MGIQLKCLGARPRGSQSIILPEYGFKSVKPGEIIDGKDLTFAQIICKNYPGCFEIFEQKDEMKAKKTQQDKMLIVQKDKDLKE